MNNFEEIKSYVAELKDYYPKLTDFEVLSIAVKMQLNDILKAGMMVPKESTKYPSALELIAMKLGADGHTSSGSLLEGIYEISSDLKSISQHLTKED